MRYYEIGQCAQNVNTNTGSIVNIITIGRACTVSLRERKRIFTLTSYNLCISRNCNPETCNEMTVFVISDSQLLTSWNDNSQSDSMAKSVCGIESVHNSVAYLSLLKLNNKAAELELRSKPCTIIHHEDASNCDLLMGWCGELHYLV